MRVCFVCACLFMFQWVCVLIACLCLFVFRWYPMVFVVCGCSWLFVFVCICLCLCVLVRVLIVVILWLHLLAFDWTIVCLCAPSRWCFLLCFLKKKVVCVLWFVCVCACVLLFVL